MIYTIGYEGLGINRFIQILNENGVRTLLDCRFNAVSMNSDFSKSKLALRLESEGISYKHLKEYGVPGEIRRAGNAIEWYIENIKPTIQASIVNRFEQPVCFMCMERSVDDCHRRIILIAMQEQGMEGRDLYPKGEKSAKKR